MPQKKPIPSRTVKLTTNAAAASSNTELRRLTKAVFSTANGARLLKELEEHYIYNRRFADHRFPNLGFENEGSAEVIRMFRFAIKQETQSNG